MITTKSIATKIIRFLAAGLILSACVPASASSLASTPTSTPAPATATRAPTTTPAPSQTPPPPTPTQTLTPTPAGACALILGSISARYILPSGSTNPIGSAVEKRVPVDSAITLVQAIILLGQPPAGATPEVSFLMSGACPNPLPVKIQTKLGESGVSASRSAETSRYAITFTPGASGLLVNYLIQIPHGQTAQTNEISVLLANLPESISSVSFGLPAGGGMTAELHAKTQWLVGDYTAVAAYGQASTSGQCRVYAPDPKILFCTFPQIPPYDTAFTLTPFLDILGKQDYQISAGMTGLIKAPAPAKTAAPTQPPGGGGGGQPPATPTPLPCPPEGCGGEH